MKINQNAGCQSLCSGNDALVLAVAAGLPGKGRALHFANAAGSTRLTVLIRSIDLSNDRDPVNASGLGAGHQVSVGKVQPIDFVDLDGA